MKNQALIIAFLAIAIFANAQDSLPRKFLKISSFIKPQNLNEVFLIKTKPLEINSCLEYKCGEETIRAYCSVDSDQYYTKYQELGKIDQTELIVINQFTYNQEFYILLNLKNCYDVILEGFPLRVENTKRFIVYNNPSTDMPWKIQILKIEDGNAYLEDEIIFPADIHPKKVLRLEEKEIFIVDDNNQIWKTVIKI